MSLRTQTIRSPLRLALGALLLPGCFLIPNEVETSRGDAVTQQAQTEKIEDKKSFSHELWAEVLEEHSEGGFVDYAALNTDPSKLDNYLALLAKFSPKSHPDLFKTEDEALAYWINAYNALCFKNVLRRYDKDFKSVIKDKEYFFYSDRFELGGEYINLNDLEKETILKGFKDPRAHFALNCASFSCPRLPEQPFAGADLDERLTEETKAFLAEERNLAIDLKSGTLTLSKLFDWYRSDFIKDSAIPEVAKAEGDKAKVIAYINHYLAEKDRVPEREGGWKLEYRKYNWLVNARGNEKGEPGVYDE